MKTSTNQFQLMVTYMEQNGDLSKPASNAHGRIALLRKWEELTEILNRDESGDMKSTEKWKKVWSDYKNNTKKKTARLYKEAKGTGDGPAAFSKLSELEQRLLNIVGVRIPTGSELEEDNQQDSPFYSVIIEPTEYTAPSPSHLNRQPWDEARPPAPLPNEPHTAASLPMREMYDSSFAVEVLVENDGEVSPCPTAHRGPARAQPARSGDTTPGRPPRATSTTTNRSSHRTRLTTTPINKVAQQFIHSEKYWRKIKMRQHKDYMEMRREQNRIRELELHTYRETHREWQAIGSRVLDILNILVSKICDK